MLANTDPGTLVGVTKEATRVTKEVARTTNEKGRSRGTS